MLRSLNLTCCDFLKRRLDNFSRLLDDGLTEKVEAQFATRNRRGRFKAPEGERRFSDELIAHVREGCRTRVLIYGIDGLAVEQIAVRDVRAEFWTMMRHSASRLVTFCRLSWRHGPRIRRAMECFSPTGNHRQDHASERKDGCCFKG